MTPDPTPAGTTNGWLNWLVCTSCWLVIWTTARLYPLGDRADGSQKIVRRRRSCAPGWALPRTLRPGWATNELGLRVTAADAVVGAAPVPAVAVVTGGGVALDGWVALEQAMLIGSLVSRLKGSM